MTQNDHRAAIIQQIQEANINDLINNAASLFAQNDDLKAKIAELEAKLTPPKLADTIAPP